jgi:CcmD family protein
MKPVLQALAAWAVLAWGTALAQDTTGSGQGASDDRAQAFQAVEGAVREDVPGGPLLVGAYALVWLVVFGYLVRLVRQQARTESDVARLTAALAEHDAKPPRG